MLAVVVAALGGELLASRARPPLALTGAALMGPVATVELRPLERPCPVAEPERPRLRVQSPPIVIKVSLPPERGK
jgi:hypothetical protein